MTLDRTTDTIAHFIGLFHLDIEEMRLRTEYEAFEFARETDESDTIEPSEIALKAPFAPEGFDPDVTYVPTDATPSPGAPARPDMNLPPPQIPDSAPIDPYGPVAPMAFPLAPAAPTAFGMLVPQPNSIMVAISQFSIMSDNDLLLFSGTARFANPDLLLQKLDALLEIAGAASIFGVFGVPLTGTPTRAEAVGLAMAVGSVEAPEAGGADISLRTGEAASGIVINGEIAEDMPVFEDLLPAILAPDDEDEDAQEERSEASEDTSEENDSGGASDTRNPEDKDEEDGASASDRAQGSTQGRDESAFAMPPDGTTSDAPLPFDVDPGHNVVTGANLAVNETLITSKWVDAPVIAVARDVVDLDIVSQVNVRAEGGRLPESALVPPSKSLNAVSINTESSIDPDTPAQAGTGQPALSNIAHVEGDLVAVNWVQQHIFASDFDRLEIEFSAAATYLSTGENTLVNVTSLIEAGFHYDLILVGGSMISINAIDQISVLLDSDMVSGSVAGGAALHARDNLQLNFAEIEKIGENTATEMKDSFKAALDALTLDPDDLSPDLLDDPLFEGIAALKALHVENNLIKLNVIEQYNYLGDADQIQLALDDFVMVTGAPVTFTTGSNAQLNSAKIKDIGLDSTVMAGGEAYSDALIHQAELIDPDAAPTGVNLSALTSEAVAFLADDMVNGAAEPDQASFAHAQDDFSNQDILQTMLA